MEKETIKVPLLLFNKINQNQEIFYQPARQCGRSLFMRHYEEFRALDNPEINQKILVQEDEPDNDDRVQIETVQKCVPLPDEPVLHEIKLEIDENS